MNNTIVLTGGGTAGHITPHFVLMNEYKKHFKNIVYIGSTNGVEKELVQSKTDIEYFGIDCVKLVRGKFFANLMLPFKLIRAISQAKKLLKQIKPDVIFSKGGFVSVPVVLSANKLKIPVVCHESDLSMGLANKICTKKAKCVCTTFEKTTQIAKQKNINAVFTGSPVIKKEITQEQINGLKLQLRIPQNQKILLVTGGSLGSQAINSAVFDAIGELSKQFFVVHLVGKGNLNPKIKAKNYVQIEFSGDMPTLIKMADVVVSRAGSNTIFELAFAKKPMLLIPLPKGASRGDQVENAQYFSECGFANVLVQSELTPNALIDAVSKTYAEKNKLIEAIKKGHLENGSNKIIAEILNAIKSTN